MQTHTSCTHTHMPASLTAVPGETSKAIGSLGCQRPNCSEQPCESQTQRVTQILRITVPGICSHFGRYVMGQDSGW